MSLSSSKRLADIGSLLQEHGDIVQERITEPIVPNWCESRGYAQFLLSLSDDALCCCEANGFLEVLGNRSDAPPSLVQLMECVRDATRVPAIVSTRQPLPTTPALIKRIKARKRAQLESLVDAASSLAVNATRIVDLGAGQGHLTRTSAHVLKKTAVGLEREPSLVDVARKLADDYRVAFRRWDAFREPSLLVPSDLVIGLHACGELGDVLVQSAAAAGAQVLLVSCCPQKLREQVREPISELGRKWDLRLPRTVLGLGNLSQLEQGVESSLRETMRSRETRHGLRLLLQRRDQFVPQGEEMRGLNRRRAYRGLASLAESAFAYRQLDPPEKAEIEECETLAHVQYGRMRRLSLPRTMFARLVELAVVLDRAVFLEEQGYEVEVSTVFDAAVSPRNLGILGSKPST